MFSILLYFSVVVVAIVVILYTNPISISLLPNTFEYITSSAGYLGVCRPDDAGPCTTRASSVVIVEVVVMLVSRPSAVSTFDNVDDDDDFDDNDK